MHDSMSSMGTLTTRTISSSKEDFKRCTKSLPDRGLTSPNTRGSCRYLCWVQALLGVGSTQPICSCVLIPLVYLLSTPHIIILRHTPKQPRLHQAQLERRTMIHLNRQQFHHHRFYPANNPCDRLWMDSMTLMMIEEQGSFELKSGEDGET